MNPADQFDVEGHAGEPITLPIAGGPATGYSWNLELPHGVQRIEDGPQREVNPSTRLGSASGGYLRVIAPAGDHALTARLARPWQQGQPARVVHIRLHVT